MKKRMVILTVSLIAVVGIIVGVSYAFFSIGGSQEQANTFTSGCLNISLTDASSSINLSNTYPITDIEGLETTSYDFTITNTCSTNTNYSINLESLNQVANSLSEDYIKVSLSSDTVGNVISILSDNTSVTPEIDGAYESYNLYTGTLGASETKTYHLKLWIDYDATVEQAANKVYQSKINVIANPETQVVDNLEATFELNDKTLTTNLTNNVTSATYCTTTDNICTPNTSVNISNNSYTVALSSATPKTKQVATALGNITVNVASSQMVCTRLNGTSKVICSNPEETSLVDFSKTSCTSGCGEATVGIYETTDNLGTAYYYRGDVENNYVQFAGYYWRIVRINGDGSIRIIYDGTSAHTNGERSSNRQIRESVFNSSLDYSYYVGYTYQTDAQRPSTQNGGTASDIKGVLDSWYSTNIAGKGYDDKVVSSAGFCNDRNTASGSNWVASGTTFNYAAYERLVTNKTPTLECSNTNDIYTTKIGLITADEVSMAGGVSGQSNNSYYLYTGLYYWTMSPYNFYVGVSSFANVFSVGSNGSLNHWNVDGPLDFRPVLNLSADVTISGGNGTMDNPYVIA